MFQLARFQTPAILDGGSIPINWLFRVFGVVFFLFGCGFLWHAWTFRRTAHEADGVVTGLSTKTKTSSSSGPGKRTKTYYRPVLQFTTHDGCDIETETRAGSTSTPAHEGDRVRVRYDPDDPTTADIAGHKSDVWGALGFTLIGLFFVLFSLLW